MRKISKFGLLIVFVIALGLLSACNGAQATQIRSCIVGIWEVDDAEAFALAVLQPGTVAPQDVTYLRGDPELAYKFDADGTVSVLAVDWNSYHDVDTIYGELPMEMEISGLAEGLYSIDNNIVTVYLVTRSEINHRAVLADEEMVNSEDPKKFLPLFVPPYNGAQFQCSGDQLQLSIVNRPNVTFTLRKTE